jgi:hypothetical protein
MDKEKGGLKGPAIDLDDDTIRHLNFTKGQGNPGLLKNEGQLTWPLALRGEAFNAERELLNSLAPEAVGRAINGRVDTGSLRDMNAAVQRMNQRLTDKIREVPQGQYVEAKRFLSYLEDALRVLGRPDAGDFFTVRKDLKGKTVADLVKFMTSKGLLFAPAVTGDEAAYMAAQRALATFDSGAKTQISAERPVEKEK